MPENIKKLTPRRRPKQGRSRDTVEAILTASQQILLRNGLKGFNTNVVAKRAGVSVGSLYQFFPGKEAILAALVRDMRRDMLADLIAAQQASNAGDLADVIGAMIDASLKHHLRAPELTATLEQAEAQLPMDAETQALKSNMFQLVLGVLQRHAIEDPETVTQDVIAMCHGMVDAAISAGERDFDEISSRLRRATINYISATN
ncbi:TetR/AcrR family transcriptional regulator [uncultured Sulfitobacter sp.]|nr:TetR/AcrR family transcriptional regulator [uncultured Sulfitobacter sp.]